MEEGVNLERKEHKTHDDQLSESSIYTKLRRRMNHGSRFLNSIKDSSDRKDIQGWARGVFLGGRGFDRRGDAKVHVPV